MLLTAAQFTERFGDPASYLFNGTYFDTGVSAKMKCPICGRLIRYCYIVKRNPASPLPPNKLTIGSCCFSYFDEKTQQALSDALGVIQHRADAIAVETKLYTRRSDVKSRMHQWRQIRHQALSELRKRREMGGKEQLPESFFDLSITIANEPPVYKRAGMAIRWYEKQIQKLEEQISKISG